MGAGIADGAVFGFDSVRGRKRGSQTGEVFVECSRVRGGQQGSWRAAGFVDGIGSGGRKRVWLTDAGFADGDGYDVEIEIAPGRRPDGNDGREVLATQKLTMLKCHSGER